MAPGRLANDEEEVKLLSDDVPESRESRVSSRSRRSSSTRRSESTASTASLILEHINEEGARNGKMRPYRDDDHHHHKGRMQPLDIEDGAFVKPIGRPVDAKYKKILWILALAAAAGWVAALVLFIITGSYKHHSTVAHDPSATSTFGHGKKVTMDQVESRYWGTRSHALMWIKGPNGQDGYVLEKGGENGRDWLVVEHVRSRGNKSAAGDAITLMKDHGFTVDGEIVVPSRVWPSPDLKTVLVMSESQRNWRHSFTGMYWLFDVEMQTGHALDPASPNERIQLATWSPKSDAVVFTRDNNMFLREVKMKEAVNKVIQLTSSGGEEMFNGVPDWVYEEEVFSSNSATWWSQDGKYIAYLATNETAVPEYPIQYFISRPSNTHPPEDEESYPEERKIKYPKAGAPNPVVHLRFIDLERMEPFDVPIDGDFDDADRLITEVVWAGESGKVLVRETNRESDILKLVLIDVGSRTGRIVRNENVMELDGGWFEVSQRTTFIPKDEGNGRFEHGYIDTIIHDGFDHLGYFTPLDNPDPQILTSGRWEVDKAPSKVDLEKNFVYFIGTKEGSTQRHVYKVNLDGTELQAVTDKGKEGYYDASFSTGGAYALLSYHGPNIPWQKVISTPSSSESYSEMVEENEELAHRAAQHELPLKYYSTIDIEGFTLNALEIRPPHFTPKKKYPVLFYQYSGPSSQIVDKRFKVDFQSFVASNLGYLVVLIDPRGTGFLGRDFRCIIRGNIGHYAAQDHIAAAQHWAAKPYVDANRLAIWGWSYGGYTALKTLEIDAGRTFQYGMIVAPVTDWRFYDSIYTERWMHTPQNNPSGYANSSVNNVTAIGQNVRFLLMHGVADDNVHFQNSLILLDKLDLAGVENYDVHVFPDSDHGISFDNAHRMVNDKLTWWLVNAFNGEWARIEDPVPVRQLGESNRKS